MRCNRSIIVLVWIPRTLRCDFENGIGCEATQPQPSEMLEEASNPLRGSSFIYHLTIKMLTAPCPYRLTGYSRGSDSRQFRKSFP